jgi:predicted phosphodiesterase
MKFALVSDVHLEFADWYPSNPDSADVLILGGDIMVAYDLYGTHKSDRFLDFLGNCAKEYKHVIYVMGNHEHYHSDFTETPKLLRGACETHGIHFLDKESVTIDDVTVIGGTLWTDMNNNDEFTLHSISRMMNDFKVIKNPNRMVSFRDQNGKFHQRVSRFSPEDSVEEHKKMMQYIQTVIEGKNDQKFVVVGHHGPSHKSVHEQYKNDTMSNGAYVSHLDDYIADHPQIKVWTHGHTHFPFDYMIGETRVICNPRGYVGYERDTEKNEPYLAKVFEV